LRVTDVRLGTKRETLLPPGREDATDTVRDRKEGTVKWRTAGAARSTNCVRY
jgi:hypothetical protein